MEKEEIVGESSNMERKPSRGRQKIPIKKIENDDERFATFSKRKLGLFAKASELCTLCDVDIGIILFSPTGKPFSFFHPTMESVVNRYFNKTPPSANYEDYVRAQVRELNGTLDSIKAQVEKENKRTHRLNEIEEKRTVKGWWEAPVVQLNNEQVRQLKAIVENFANQMNHRMKEKRVVEEGSSSSSSSSMNPQGYFSNVVQPGFFVNSNANAGSSSRGTQGDFQSAVEPGFFPNVNPNPGLSNFIEPGFFPNVNVTAGPSSIGVGHFGGSSSSWYTQGDFHSTIGSAFFPNPIAGPSSDGVGQFGSASSSWYPQGESTIGPEFFPNPIAGPSTRGVGQFGASSSSRYPQGDLQSTVGLGFFQDPNASASRGQGSSSGNGQSGASYYNQYFGGGN